MNLHELSSLGLEFGFIFIGSVFLGIYIDNKFSISPFGILTFTILGFSFAIYYIVMRANRFQNKDQNNKK
jgi:F0F1-type ATP synthase assembly protein I